MCSMFYKRQPKALEVVNPVVFLSFLIFELIEKKFYRNIQKFLKNNNNNLVVEWNFKNIHFEMLYALCWFNLAAQNNHCIRNCKKEIFRITLPCDIKYRIVP